MHQSQLRCHDDGKKNTHGSNKLRTEQQRQEGKHNAAKEKMLGCIEKPVPPGEAINTQKYQCDDCGQCGKKRCEVGKPEVGGIKMGERNGIA